MLTINFNLIKGKFLLMALLHCCIVKAQKINIKSLSLINLKTGIWSQKVASDSLVSSFYLIINDGVKMHKHLHHSEHVFVLKGKGIMQLADSVFVVKPNDVIFIPQNTPHKLKVTKKPFHCISIQAPYFDGTDRILME